MEGKSLFLLPALLVLMLACSLYPATAQTSTITFSYSDQLLPGMYQWEVSPVSNSTDLTATTRFLLDKNNPSLFNGGTITMIVSQNLEGTALLPTTDRNNYFSFAIDSQPVSLLLPNGTLSVLSTMLLPLEYSISYTPTGNDFGFLFNLLTPTQITTDGNSSNLVDLLYLFILEANVTSSLGDTTSYSLSYDVDTGSANVSMVVEMDVNTKTGILIDGTASWGTDFSVDITLINDPSKDTSVMCYDCSGNGFIPFWGLGAIFALPMLVQLKKWGKKL